VILRENPDKIAIVDADSLVYSVGFASEDAEAKYAIARMAEKLEEMLFLELGVEKYEGYLTGQGNYRNELAKTAPYKGNRKGEKPKHYAILREYLNDAWGFVTVNNIEADDIVAIKATRLGESCIVVSIDKDLWQVPGEHYDWKNKRLKTVTKEEGLKNFYAQILTGDRIDNIIGIKQVGPVKAANLLKDCKTWEDYYNACVCAYEKAGELASRVDENASLLWLQRAADEQWSKGIEGKYYG
jgi:adenine specific DNA methylase Mod